MMTEAELKATAVEIKRLHAEATEKAATIGRKLLEAYELFPADVLEKKGNRFFRHGWHKWLREQGIKPDHAAYIMKIAREKTP
jgi:hypothetical protein